MGIVFLLTPSRKCFATVSPMLKKLIILVLPLALAGCKSGSIAPDVLDALSKLAVSPREVFVVLAL
jgi:hypothetical protein